MDITLQHVVDGAVDDAAQVKLRDSTGTFGIKETVSGATVVPPTSAIAPSSNSIYSYNVDALDTGISYTAVWEMYYPTLLASPRYHTLVFNVDADITLVDGVTLAEIEWELVQRIGPHRKLTIEAGLSQTISTILSNTIKSRIPRGQWQDHYVLRRGVRDDPDNPTIAGFNPDDRVRGIEAYTPETGALTVDRNYTNAVHDNEIIEIMYLHPDVIRESVRAGLKRAKLPDTVTITVSGLAAERNLTSSIAWLTRETQIQSIRVLPQGLASLAYPYDFAHKVFIPRQGDLYVRLFPDPYPATIEVRALRPAFNLVNGAVTLSGPNDDNDILSVSLEYAAAAAHIELWRRNAAELQAAAQLGYQVTKKEAANTFSALAKIYKRTKPRKIQHASPYGYRRLPDVVVVG